LRCGIVTATHWGIDIQACGDGDSQTRLDQNLILCPQSIWTWPKTIGLAGNFCWIDA
jgi:hypothetical protein